MADPVRLRRLTDQEGQQLLRITRRGAGSPIRFRRAMVVLAGSNHPNHAVLARKLHAYLRWRDANACHPDVLAAQRRERGRVRVRSERQRRWGQPAARAA